MSGDRKDWDDILWQEELDDVISGPHFKLALAPRNIDSSNIIQGFTTLGINHIHDHLYTLWFI